MNHFSQQLNMSHISQCKPLVSCPHRLWMDCYGDPAEQDPINPFVQMLWEKGSLYEADVIDETGTPFLDLSIYSGDEKERRTTEAMQQGVPLIYSGRMCEEGLLGDPDLLRKETGGYIAGDIKSGAGEEGDENNRRPKKHYAVQLALYISIWHSGGMRLQTWGSNSDAFGIDAQTFGTGSFINIRNSGDLWVKTEGGNSRAFWIAAFAPGSDRQHWDETQRSTTSGR
ncbi:MAG: hypothetical protein GY792_24405 [Gammaproteobacteria bacterium]|nr:hypothetical protein [Gammaproteobacteria bacterium]